MLVGNPQFQSSGCLQGLRLEDRDGHGFRAILTSFLGILGLYRGSTRIIPILENQMEKNMENEMETEGLKNNQVWSLGTLGVFKHHNDADSGGRLCSGMNFHMAERAYGWVYEL